VLADIACGIALLGFVIWVMRARGRHGERRERGAEIDPVLGRGVDACAGEREIRSPRDRADRGLPGRAGAQTSTRYGNIDSYINLG